jgi:hypothetical protein
MVTAESPEPDVTLAAGDGGVTCSLMLSTHSPSGVGLGPLKNE